MASGPAVATAGIPGPGTADEAKAGGSDRATREVASLPTGTGCPARWAARTRMPKITATTPTIPSTATVAVIDTRPRACARTAGTVTKRGPFGRAACVIPACGHVTAQDRTSCATDPVPAA